MRTRQIHDSSPAAVSRHRPVVLSAFVGAALALALTGLPACQPATSTAGERTADPGAAPADEPTATAQGGETERPADGEAPTRDEDRTGKGGDKDKPDEHGDGERVPMVDRDHPQYGQVEGTGYDNNCDTDADCHVGGCSGEVCSADPEVTTTCIMPGEGWASAGGSCGCLAGQCTWYTGGGEGQDDASEVTPGRSPHAIEGQGEACRSGACPGDLTCVEYYGVAGPHGPKFSSCEIPCPRGTSDVCPEGQTCVTIADGPGQVCRGSRR